MGARTLESSLRGRLLLLVAPALVAVAAIAVLVTWRALWAADEDAARTRASALVTAFDAELGEGDPPDMGASEVLAEVTKEGVAATLLDDASGRRWDGGLPLAAEIAALPAGQCALARSGGVWWRGCRVRRGDHEAVAAMPVTSHVGVVANVAEAMGVVLVAALVALVLAGRAAVKQPLASVGRLVEWSESVVAAGGEPPPPPAADSEEMRRLGGAFDALVRRLVQALARERATAAHIAHELRTPLTAMRAELEELLPSGGDRVERMLGDADRLARVIDAILLLSSPQKAEKTEGVVNVADVVRELAPRGAEVDAPDEALVDADPNLVELAVHNLIENALKHGGRPARAVHVTRVEGGVRVSVVDDGKGMAPDAIPHIFDRYWRGSGDVGGTGLGLALVRAVAERYGGAVHAAPAAGSGLEVGITFGRVLGWHAHA